MHVLFVCTGNICRSPIAERLAVAYGAQLRVSGLEVSSAGTRAVVGHPIHHEAALVLRGLGGDATDFSARRLTAGIAMGADLILTMTKEHRGAVLEIAPRRLHRTFTIVEVAKLVSECGAGTIADLAAFRSQIGAQETSDIADPIGNPPDVFEEVGSKIAALLPPILDLCLRSVNTAND